MLISVLLFYKSAIEFLKMSLVFSSIIVTEDHVPLSTEGEKNIWMGESKFSSLLRKSVTVHFDYLCK